MSRIATNENLTDDRTKSKAEARALVLQSLAGRARIAAELIMGRSIVAGEDAAIPANPCNDLGVNMSGPPWGSAWIAPHIGTGGITPDTGNFLGQRLLGSFVTGSPWTYAIRHFVQRHESYQNAPLSRLRPVIRAACASGGPVSVTWTCSVEGDGGAERTAVVAVASTTEQTINESSLWWDVKPGRNRLLLTASSSSATEVYILGLSLDVTAKRSY
jgi:hypothetical protein